MKRWGEAMTESIIKKWKKQGNFIRFVNGDKGCSNLDNLAYVSLKDALKNIDNWVVDWDINLTEEEIKLVRTPAWREGLQF